MGLTRDIEQGGHLVLHAEAEFVRFDDALDRFGRVRPGGEVAVEFLDQVELRNLHRTRHAGLNVGQVTLIADRRTLVVSRQESTAIVHRAAEVGRRIDDHVARKVLIISARP